ncbi:MAG TPA: metalloregulator ArsR/SmtB family transcription factor [Aggregatilineales bacterium]|nr:metalloregulator ArsR/SmtB family transcription factor [Aggregatilineales bacterium]
MTDKVALADTETLTRVAEIFATLGDPTRLRMIAALTAGEMSVGELARTVAISESAVSHQLRLLRALRIVRGRRSGREVFYTLDDQHVHDLLLLGIAHSNEKNE